MSTGVGFDFDITGFNNALDEADKKLNKIQQTSNNVKKDIVSMFNEISISGIEPFIKKINEANNALKQFSEGKISFSAISGIGEPISKAIDEINRMTIAVDKLKEQQRLALESQQIKLDYKKQSNDVKELAVAENERARAIERVNKANIATNKNKERLNILKEKNEIQELINIERERSRNLVLANKKNLAAYKKENIELKRLQGEIDRLAKAYSAMPTKLKQADVNKILSQSNKASTINQHIVSINNLKNALRDLNVNSKNYKQNVENINKAIHQEKQALARLGVSLDDVQKKKNHLMNTSSQLQRQIALLFSVSAIQGYVNKLVGVRQEFEIQQKSIGVLLNNKDEANKLWQQTVDLAVRSPFRVKELVTYTRQLAAYRIETDKLHDTTKRLADVSAGLGVDMQRLILAYGQVRAANFLRGTELRQFTEAGIPMLDELAKHFSNMEDKAISTGEVFERISKRMVTFADVEKVFKNMTDEGGTFYKMQEKQAETIFGLRSNLKDSIDLMLNDIGRANDSLIKGTLATTKTLVENWKLLAEILQQIGTGVLLISIYKGITKITTLIPNVAALILTIEAFNARLAAGGVASALFGGKLKNLITVLKNLKIALSTPLFKGVGLIAAIASITHALYAYNKAIKETNKQYDDASEREYTRMRAIDDLIKKIEANNKVIQENNEGEEELNKVKKQNADLLKQIANEYPNISNLLKQQENGVIDLTEAVEQHNNELRTNIALQQASKKSWWQEDLATNYKEATEAQKEAIKSMYDLNSSAITALTKLEILYKDGKIDNDYYNRFKNLLQTLEKAESLEDISNVINQRDYDFLIGQFSQIKTSVELAIDAYDEFDNKIEDVYDNLDNHIPIIATALNEIEEPEKRGVWLNRKLQELNILDSKILELAQKYIKEKIKINIELPKIGSGDGDKQLEEWAIRINEAVDKINKKVKDKIKGIQDKDLFPKIDENDTNVNAYINRASGRIDEINKKYVQGQKIVDQNTVDTLDSLKEFVPEFARIINISTESKEENDSWANSMVQNLRDAHQEYEKLKKQVGKVIAKEQILLKYSKLFAENVKGTMFNDVLLEDIDFTNEEKLLEALNEMLKKLPSSASKARKAIYSAIKDIEGGDIVEKIVNSDAQLVENIKKMFGNYEITLELEKINLPTDLAEKLYGITPTSLNEIKSAIKGALKDATIIEKGDLIQQLKTLLSQVDDLEAKQYKERLNKYQKYLMKAQSEHVRIKVEEMKQISEIESLKIGNAEKSLMIEGVKKETNKKLQKNTLDEFQRTETYLTLYSDLENTSDKVLEALVVKLRELKTSLSDLPAEDLKKLVSQIERAEEVLIKRNPFKALRDLKKQMEGIESEDVLSNKLISLATKRERAQKILDKEEFNLLNINPNSVHYADTELTITTLKNIINLTDKQIQGIKKLLNLYDQERDGYDAMKDAVNSYKQEIDKLFGSIENLMNALGVESDSIAFIILDSAKSMASLITSAIMFRAQLKAMKVEANAALGVIGWIAMAIEAIAMGISSVFKAHDNKLSKQLELQAKQVERLEKEFENLNNLIDEASSVTLLKSYSDEAISNLKRQRVAYQQMYALEDDKKSSDEAKMEDYKDKMAELDKQILEQQQETINKARGNIIDDVLSTANSFTDAWLNAFQETSNGMSGLKNNFREMMLDMVKQQASLTITGSYLEKWKAELGKYINADDVKLTSEEAKKWVSSVTSTLPQLNEALENYFNAMSAAGIDVSGGELSSLEKGIQSITAAQAEAISAYLSSIRFFVSEQHTNVAKIATYMTNNEFFNPIVSQLQSVVEHTKAVKDLLESIRSTNGVSSHGIKVFIE